MHFSGKAQPQKKKKKLHLAENINRREHNFFPLNPTDGADSHTAGPFKVSSKRVKDAFRKWMRCGCGGGARKEKRASWVVFSVESLKLDRVCVCVQPRVKVQLFRHGARLASTLLGRLLWKSDALFISHSITFISFFLFLHHCNFSPSTSSSSRLMRQPGKIIAAFTLWQRAKKQLS